MRAALQVSRSIVIAALMRVPGSPLYAETATSALNEPWSVSSRDPVTASSPHMAKGSAVVPFELGLSLTRDFAYGWLRFYQSSLSTVGTARCPMAPSCSRFSIQAINTHGVAIGIVMTADRLLHEADEKRWAVQTRDATEVKYLDPLENNDFWWYRR